MPSGGEKRVVRQLNRSFIMVGISIFCIAASCFANLSGSLDEKQVLLRIKPEGEVTVQAGAGQTASPANPIVAKDIGQQRYEEVCHICHESGLAGAPKVGDKADWGARLGEQGMENLVKRAIQGYKAMPPKGTCTACSDEEIRKAIEYMLSQSK